MTAHSKPSTAESGLCTWARVTMRCVCHRGETKYVTCAQRSVDFLPPFCPDCSKRVEVLMSTSFRKAGSSAPLTSPLALTGVPCIATASTPLSPRRSLSSHAPPSR